MDHDGSTGGLGRSAGAARAWLAGAGLVVGLAVIACRQLVGIHDEPPGAAGTADAGESAEAGPDGSASDGGLAWVAPACGACVEGACGAELAACLGDVPCAQSIRCLAACDGHDEACRGACFTQGDDTLAALLRCQATSCASASECNLQCGGFFGPMQTLSAPCTACYVEYGCTAGSWCATQSLACLGAKICTDACDPLDWVCISNCYASHPDDVPDAAWGADFTAAAAHCGSACGFDDVWSCVGKVTWPVPHTNTTATFKIQVVDLATGAALPGAQIRLCANGDTQCATPLPTGTTTADDGGNATITAPAAFAGYMEVSAEGYPAQLSYFYPPIAEDLTPLQYIGASALSSSYLDELSKGVGVALDPSRGLIVAAPRDCNDEPAPGVSFQIAPAGDASVPYYVLNNVPTPPPEATATTNPSPRGGFVNVDPGSVVFSATNDGGVAFAKVSVTVRAGAVTWLRGLVPTP